MLIVFIILIIFLSIVGVGVLFGAPFVPTRKVWIDDALKLAQISHDDVVVDLGSGNGAVLNMALKHGAKRVIGYEINPILVLWSRISLRKFGHRAEIKVANIFNEQLPSDATVIYLFQVNKVMKKIPDFIIQQRDNITAKKLRVVCFGFQLSGAKQVKKLNGMTMYEF